MPYVCSLKTETPQLIPADGGYHIVRFPYGTAESSDEHGMHQSAQPDGYQITDWAKDDRSGLVWPTLDGWASLNAMVFWDSGNYTEIRDRFVRDPLGLAGEPDSTCTEDHPTTPGGQYRAKHWELFAHPGTPLALLVRHNASAPVNITLAELKLSIFL